MATDAFSYLRLIDSMTQGLAHFPDDPIKVMLLDTYDVGDTANSAQYVADVLTAAVEVVGTGYDAGGVTLTGVTWTMPVDAPGTYSLSADDPSWPDAAITASFALFYLATTGDPTTDPVLCAWDFGAAMTTPEGSAFTLPLNTAGLYVYSAS